MKYLKLFLILGLIGLVTGCSFEISKKTDLDNDNDSSKQEDIKRVVPDVSGMTVEDAKSVLEMNGFKVGETLLLESTNYEEGLVIKTNPNVGQSVKKGTIVNLYVSTNFTYEVEDYTGKSCFTVKRELEELGLLVEVIKKSYLEDYDIYTIVEQEPGVGTVLKKEDTVKLYIPIAEDLYPDFVNEKWTVQDIESFASIYSLNLTKKFQQSSNYEPGLIIRQSREAGSKIVEGSTLEITISE